MKLTFSGLPTATIHDIKTSGRDTYDLPVETHTSNGDAYPCRHCFGAIPTGEAYLILAHRPFEGVNAYTETGPIFLCAADCAAYDAGEELPATLNSPTYLVRGYDGDERIRYGTGAVVARDRILDHARAVLRDEEIEFVDIRSAMNNCWQGRLSRAAD